MIEKFWDFMDSCSLFLLLSTFFGGYDLYIIAIISPLEPERAAEARRAVVASLRNVQFFTFSEFGGTKITLDDKEFTLFREHDIVAKFAKE